MVMSETGEQQGDPVRDPFEAASQPLRPHAEQAYRAEQHC
jgi:hypothetical protein